jgi:two-component system NtrC family sensor kinase
VNGRALPLPLLLVGMALASALLFFYLRMRDYDASRYFDEISLVQRLKQIDATWERDTLRVKVGILRDYDALADPLDDLDPLQRQLGAVASTAPLRGMPELAQLVAGYRSALRRKIELIEEFKSHDAVLRNSVAFLPQARDDLQAMLAPEQSALVLGTLLDTLEFAQHGSDEEHSEAADGLQRLAAIRPSLGFAARERLDIFIAHSRTVLREYAVVEKTLLQLDQVPTGARLDQMALLLTRQEQQADLQAHTYRQSLLLFSTALAALLLYAAFRLLRSHAMVRRFNAELRQANELLEQRVAERTQALQSANQLLHTEIAERQQLETRLVQSEKLASIGQLAAGVAHEINNPLGFLSSNFGMLEEYLASLFGMLDSYEDAENSGFAPALAHRLPARRAELQLDFLRRDIPLLMEQSRDGMNRVSKIVQSLKDFSRASPHNDWQWTDLHQGIDSTLHIIASELRQVAEVRKEYGALPKIECNPSELNQVFLNLLVNAGHAVFPGRGVITIRSGREDEEAWVEVADNGSGIPPDVLPRIFDPFFTTKPVGKGTGLGLSVSHGIIRHHGGRIEVSTAPGQGTAFRVVLPLQQSAIPAREIEACLIPA